MHGRGWLTLAGILSLVASLLHIGCILFGAEWFRFLGAPEETIRAYETGNSRLVWMTVVIAAVLAIWAAYAFSGAGRIRRLPLLRTGLVIITAIYLVRGLVLIPALMSAGDPIVGPTVEFDILSSAIVLIYALAYGLGTWFAWPRLRPDE